MKNAGGGKSDQAKEREHDRAGEGRRFMQDVVTAMGLSLDVHVVDTPDAIRIEFSGEGGEVLLKRKGEALDALQQIVNTGFRRELDDDRSFVVDCMGYRRARTTS